MKDAVVTAKQGSELITVPEAAQFFRVTVSTIRSWVLYRKIPFVKVGGRLVRFRRADLERVVSSKVVPAKVVRDEP